MTAEEPAGSSLVEEEVLGRGKEGWMGYLRAGSTRDMVVAG